MPARAGIKVTKARVKTRAAPKKKVVALGGGTRRCPACGKFMGNKKNG